MLRKLLKRLRQAKNRRYVRVLEKQLTELLKRGASPAEIEAKRAALMRARQRLAGVLLATVIFPACARGNEALRETLETATIAADAALERCEAKLKASAGDESQRAVAERRACLKMPDLGATQDAIDALAHEAEQIRYWTLTGEIR